MEKDDLNLILLNAGYALHDADWNWKNVSSPFMRLYLVTQGEASIIIAGKEYRLTQGHLYLVPPFALHSNSCTGHFELYYLHIYELINQTISLFEQMIFPVEVEICLLDQALMKRLLEINPNRGLLFYDPSSYDNNSNLYKCIAVNSHIPYHVGVETDGIVRQLFSRFIAAASMVITTHDTRLIKVLRFIREHIDEKISVTQLASIASLTPDHFIRLFKLEIGVTPLDYINRKKIERAQLMLLINNQPVKDIAYSISFENVSYFNRLFKNLVGVTPSECRSSFNGLSNC